MKESLCVLFDTSALVAVLSATGAHHADCIAALRTMVGPRVTTWPVITGAHYLLRREPKAQEKLQTKALESFGDTG